MLSLRKVLTVLLGSLLLIGICASAQARLNVIISVAPPIREVIVPPQGYQTCYEAPSGFYNGIWINHHSICEYDDSPEGGAWVAGYWQCVKYRHTGTCLRWGWVGSHWENSRVREYGLRPYPHRHHSYRHNEYRSGYGGEEPRDVRGYNTGVPASGTSGGYGGRSGPNDRSSGYR